MFQLDGSAFFLDEVERCGPTSDGSKGQQSAGQGRGTLLGREDQSGTYLKLKGSNTGCSRSFGVQQREDQR